MAAKQKILIIDRDFYSAEQISLCLKKEYYDTRTAMDAEEAWKLFMTYTPQLIIMDPVLPNKDGFQFCKELRRKSDTPLIMLSSKGEIIDKVLGLELGADDYMTKPFDTRELIARVHAVLRRYSIKDPSGPEEKKVEYPNLVINLTNYTVLYNGKAVYMPPKELELLHFLASSPNQVFTREQLLDRIWGYDYVGDTRTVDVHIKRIRQKIKQGPEWKIATVWGIGYKFVPDPAD